MAFKRRRFRRIFRPFRRFARRLRRRRMQPTVIRNRGALASDRAIVHLKYVDHHSLVPGAVFNAYDYNLNSLFDPDRTGSGSFPTGYTQWNSLYSRYRVFAVSYRVSFSVNSAAGGAAMNCITVPSNGATVITSLEEALSQRFTKSAFAQYQSNVGRIRGKISLPRLNGRTVNEYRGSDSTQAAYNANPTEILILHVCFASADGGTGVQISYTIELTYHAEMFDRNTI